MTPSRVCSLKASTGMSAACLLSCVMTCLIFSFVVVSARLCLSSINPVIILTRFQGKPFHLSIHSSLQCYFLFTDATVTFSASHSDKYISFADVFNTVFSASPLGFFLCGSFCNGRGCCFLSPPPHNSSHSAGKSTHPPQLPSWTPVTQKKILSGWLDLREDF